MKAKFAEPEQFIRDLGKVSATLVSPAVVEEFLCDLDKVHRQILAGQKLSRPVSVDTFDQLAGVFKGTRLGALKRIGGKDFLEKLPANDPLRCPVSLFGSLDLGLHETAHKIPWQTAEDFTLDADAVIKKTKQALEVISPKFIGDFLDGW